MKKLVSLGIIISGLVSASWSISTPAAEEASPGFLGDLFSPHFESDFGASVGYKAWFNRWTAFSGTVSSGVGHGSSITLTGSYELASIPVLSLRYKNFFVSGSYFPETTYSFPFTTVSLPLFNPDGTRATSGGNAITAPFDVNASASREEYDVSVGYYLNQFLAVTAGYKNIRQFTDATLFRLNAITGARASGAIIEDHFNNKITGPMVGLVGSVPIGNRFGLYGNFAYGFLSTDFFSGGVEEGTRDTPYYLAEGGVSYAFATPDTMKYLKALTAYVGYRNQTFYRKDVANGQDATDTTQGFVAGLNLSF